MCNFSVILKWRSVTVGRPGRASNLPPSRSFEASRNRADFLSHTVRPVYYIYWNRVLDSPQH